MSSRPHDAQLIRQLTSGFLWMGALLFALAWYLVFSKLLRALPPTDPIAVGRVTVEGLSKLRDYVAAAILYLFVPVATVVFYRLAAKAHVRLMDRLGDASATATHVATVLFALPFCLAPFLYIATRSEGRAILLPFILSALGSWAAIQWQRHHDLRALFFGAMQPYHALVVFASLSWALFRYTTTEARFASDNTLFLELPFLLLTVLLFEGAVIVISLLLARARGETVAATFPRIAWATSPFLLLAPLGLTWLTPWKSLAAVAILSALLVLLAVPIRRTFAPSTTRMLAGWVILPMLLFCLNFATTASSTHWTDLFHRGEALGPASDYLRGKVPYRDVFVFHGMLENGFLDAGLMSLFGRDVQVSAMRVIVFDCLGLSAIGLLAMAVFNSIPLALATLAVALVTSVGNQRAMLEIVSVAFLVLAIRKGTKLPLVFSGLFAALALFYSFETGIYSIGGAVVTLIAIAILDRAGVARSPFRIPSALGAYASGFATVTVPIAIYLGVNGALDDFFRISFVTLPSAIDAVWGIPFPRFETTFASDRTLRRIADFVFGEGIRFVLNPAILITALVYLVARTIRRSLTRDDQLLLALTFTTVLTQRSALGRADFPHQYFAAFLAGPIVVLLIIAFRNNLSAAVAEHGTAGRVFATAVLIAAGAAAFVGLWVPDLINARIDGAAAYRSRMTGGGNPEAGAITRRVDAVREELLKRLPADAPLFDFSNQPAFYFFTDRPNPTRFYQIPIVSVPHLQQEAISRLEASRPEIILRGSPAGFDAFDGIPNELRAPALAAYIDERYRYAVSVEGVELWERIDSDQPFVLGNYLAKHRMPSGQEIADSRLKELIFPSIGSGAGAGESSWRTDLFLHNAADRPTGIRLRYRTPQSFDRRLTLAPRASMRIEDVVSTLLGAPGTFGSLVVQVPESVPVVARVVSYDASRGTRGIPVQPLTAEDAASADGPMRQLVVPGNPSMQQRRMNLDVVNIGGGSAEIAIAVFGSDGSQKGQTLSSGIVEGGAWKISDVESKLGVQVDESRTIRITVGRGTIVASASIVDPLSGQNLVVPATPIP